VESEGFSVLLAEYAGDAYPDPFQVKVMS